MTNPEKIIQETIERLTKVEPKTIAVLPCPHCGEDLNEIGLQKEIEFSGWDRVNYGWDATEKKFMNSEDYESLDCNENTGEEYWKCPECNEELSSSFLSTLEIE